MEIRPLIGDGLELFFFHHLRENEMARMSDISKRATRIHSELLTLADDAGTIKELSFIDVMQIQASITASSLQLKKAVEEIKHGRDALPASRVHTPPK